MPSPGVKINLFDLTVFAPATSNAIFGMVGPATKGPVQTMETYTDEGVFVTRFGRPNIERTYAQRAAIRYLKRGNQLRFIRVAGSLLASASTTLLAADGRQEILLVEAASPGTWANDGAIEVAIQHNPGTTGPVSYNVLVYQDRQLVESYLQQDNGVVANTLNTQSARIRVTLLPGAGATFPDETTNAVTGALDRVPLSGGDDGAFASTRSPDSTTGPIAGKRFYGTMDATSGSRTWATILDPIPGTLAGLSIYRGSLGMPVLPGTVTIRAETAAATFVELADSAPSSPSVEGSGVGILEPSAGSHLGSIDYRTGNFVIYVDAATFFVGGEISGIWVRAENENVGAQVRGLGDYAGGLSQTPAPGFYNANKASFFITVDEQIGDVPLGAAGASGGDPLLKNLSGRIVPGTVVLTPTDVSAQVVPPAIYDDGLGGFRTAPNGGGVPVVGASLNYGTGAWVVPAWDPVGAVPFPGVTAAQIQAEYVIQVHNMGGGAVPGPDGTWAADVVQPADAGGDALAADTDPGALRLTGPILPGNVRLLISDVGGVPTTYYDDGLGGWMDRQRGDPEAAAVTGAIDYDTGAWSITAGAVIGVGATITASYTSVAIDQARRSLRGPTAQALGAGGYLAAGLSTDAPAAGNDLNSGAWLDHTTGEFGFELNLVTTGTNTFDLKDSEPIQVVYAQATILGWGDGTETVFAGTVSGAPFRRQAGRLLAFQSAQVSLAGSGEAQVSHGQLGASPTADYWQQNVAAPTDPDNFLSFGTGATSIQWTGAPSRDEATFVIGEDTVAHVTARYPGDMGNERANLSDGLWVDVGADPSLAGTLRLRVWFETNVVESFGQATTLAELISKVNDADSGSDLVRLEEQLAGSSLSVDASAAQNIGMAGAFTTADVVGTRVGQTFTGLQAFRNEETVPLHFVTCPGQWHRQVILAMQELCEKPGRRAIGIVSLPDEEDPYVHRDFLNGNYNASTPGGPARATAWVPFPPLAELNSSQLTDIGPWVKYFDAYSNAEPWEPAEGELAQLIANTDNVAKPWFPVAGFRRGKVTVSDIRYSASKEDRDLLYGVVGQRTEVLNLIVKKIGRGLALLGQRTLQRNPSATDRLNVRWTLNVIMNLIDFVSQEFLFELNDSILWREAEAALNSVIGPIVERRGLQDAHIEINGSTTTADDIDALRMRGKLFIKPARAVEEIEYDLILTPTGASFEEVRIAG